MLRDHTAAEVAETFKLSTARIHAITAAAAGSTKPKRGDEAHANRPSKPT